MVVLGYEIANCRVNALPIAPDPPIITMLLNILKLSLNFIFLKVEMAL
jgi:hypothetical protein